MEDSIYLMQLCKYITDFGRDGHSSSREPTWYLQNTSEECQPLDNEVPLFRFQTLLKGISYVTKAP